MPSQEDYLDKLLRSLGAELLNEDEQTEESELDTEEAAPESALPENIESSEAAVDLDALLPEAEESAIDLDALLPESEAEAVEPELQNERLMEAFEETSDEPLQLDDGQLEKVDDDVIGQYDAMSEAEFPENIAVDAEAGISGIEDMLPDEFAEIEDLPEDILSDIGLSEEFTVTEDLSAATPEIDYDHTLEDILDSDDGLVLGENDILDEEDYQAFSDLDTLNSMSEDDIERIISAGAGELEDATDETELAEDDLENDVLGMLEDSDDGDLQEIHQLLDRADNNEAVDDKITALLQEAPPEEDLEKKILGEDTESLDPKTQKAMEKEKLRQEKAAAKKAAKEAKAAAKAAAKEAKAAAKNAKNNATAHEQVVSALPEVSNEMATNDLFDSSILDSIVSEANEASTEKSTDIVSQAIGEGMGEDDIFSDSDLLGVNTGDENRGSGDDKLTGKAESDDGLGFDMGSLFGDSDDSSLGFDAAEPEDLANFPDFVDVDGDNVDNLVSGIDEGGKKKKGLLAKIFDFLTEEDEEEETEALQLSDENREILNDLDKEKTTGKKKKKGKKGAAKGEEGKGKGKPKKEKKPKRPKPEKPKKEKVPEPEPLIPERRLTLKRVLPVLLVCASLAALIIIFINASVDFTSKKTAQEAYYNGDYQTCYQNLYGRDLNEAEQIMYGTSESVLRIRLWLAEYELFVDSGEDLRALDSLITAVKEYPKLYAYAVQWNAGDEVESGYQHLLTILSQNYGLTQEQALEIANARSDIEYTRMVLFIVQGRGFGSWNESNTVTKPSPESTGDQLPDALPEEGEMDASTFINN